MVEEPKKTSVPNRIRDIYYGYYYRSMYLYLSLINNKICL